MNTQDPRPLYLGPQDLGARTQDPGLYDPRAQHSVNQNLGPWGFELFS